jgi:hypothetical protein
VVNKFRGECWKRDGFHFLKISRDRKISNTLHYTPIRAFSWDPVPCELRADTHRSLAILSLIVASVLSNNKTLIGTPLFELNVPPREGLEKAAELALHASRGSVGACSFEFDVTKWTIADGPVSKYIDD